MPGIISSLNSGAMAGKPLPPKRPVILSKARIAGDFYFRQTLSAWFWKLKLLTCLTRQGKSWPGRASNLITARLIMAA
jgi:hypothetical protein